jgi:hypothetical protein
MTRDQLRLADTFGRLERIERRILEHALQDYINKLSASELPYRPTADMLNELLNFNNSD